MGTSTSRFYLWNDENCVRHLSSHDSHRGVRFQVRLYDLQEPASIS